MVTKHLTGLCGNCYTVSVISMKCGFTEIINKDHYTIKSAKRSQNYLFIFYLFINALWYTHTSMTLGTHTDTRIDNTHGVLKVCRLVPTAKVVIIK